jgi:ABC-type transport system substrate-binding protein
MGDYWHKTLTRRIGRRRLIAGTGATAFSAAFLAACGGDDDDSSSGTNTGGNRTTGSPTSDLLAKVEDTTSQAKVGGTWGHYITQDLQSLDPYKVTSSSAHAPWTYSRLVRYKATNYPEPVSSDVEPDGASSWEESPDGLTFTFKLRPEMKFDPRPPTSGRVIDADDVAFSAEKFKATGLSRAEFYNELAPTSPVQSVTAIDKSTVQVKLAFPMANMLARFAFQRYLYIMPKEADGGFDPANTMRGSGPWRLVEWQPSQGFRYERNDEWATAPGQPFLAGINVPIISEYAQRRSQLVAGNIWADNLLIPEDVLPVKKEQPAINLYANVFPDTRPNFINFGLLPGSPFHDARVRRATSMLLDRDLYIETAYNLVQYESEGLPVEWHWHTHFAAGEPPYWIDPKGDGLGEPARYFQYDPDEAKKLIDAAGIRTPITGDAVIGRMGVENQKDILLGMLNESGLYNLQMLQPETNEYNSKYFNGGGLHEGIVLENGPAVGGDIDSHISVRFNVGAAPQCFYREVYPWYTKTQQLVESQRNELDEQRRLGILKDLQIEMADQMVAVPWPGIASNLSVAWPYLANFKAFTPRSNLTEQSETWPRYWYNA